MTILAPRYSNLNGSSQGNLTSGVELSTIINLIGNSVEPLIINVSVNVTSNTTVPSNISLSVLNGSIINISNGVTLTINGTFSAGVYQVFNCQGNGNVVFNNQTNLIGYAEWWGAITNNSSSNIQSTNTLSINAALTALSIVQLMPADYYVSGTIIHQRPNCWLKGAASKYNSIYGLYSTRLLIGNATGTALQIGPTNAPTGGINSFPEGLRVSDLLISRTVGPDISASSPGVLVNYTLYAILERILSTESINTFYFKGTVSTKVIDCQATRSVAGTGTGTDLWKGFYIDGVSYIVGAGGNASLYLIRPNASCNLASLQTTNSTGFYLNGAYTDSYIDWPETNSCYVGMDIEGNNATGNSFSNTDLHINHPINDSFYYCGIYINNIAQAGSFSIEEPYFGPAPSARCSLWINSSLGGGNITGGQFVQGNSTAAGVIIQNSNAVILDGAQILETANTYPVVVLNASSNCLIKPKIKNTSITASAAVQLSGICNANQISPIITGKASAFTLGVQVVDANTARTEFNCSGTDSFSISGGSPNKLVINGTQIITTGTYGSNVVSGVMS